MTVQYSVSLRNAKLDVNESHIGTAPIFEIRTGAQPADCATAPSGNLLVQGALPSDWANPASGGTKTKNGTWSFTAVGAGTAGHYRIYESGSPSVCHEQGSITATGGGGDMTLDNTSIAIGQTVTVNTFTKSAGNA